MNFLRNKAYRASIWILVGYGGSQVLRLGGNLILTRLLVPEFYGILAIAQVILQGLGLFSDIGLGPSIIRSKRSGEAIFLNTAWTLQIIRGIILFLLAFAVSGPVASFYDSPELAQVLPVVALTFVLTGFNSTSIFTLNKKVQLGKITLMELTSKALGIILMIGLAYYYRNIWSLVIGGIFSTTINVCWSHFLEKESKNRIGFEKEAAHEIFTFGKWIFLATAMMFLATQADRMLLGKYFPMALFGVYNIAVIFAELPKQILNQLSNKVIFPLMTEFAHLPREEFRQKILSKRKLLLISLALLIAVFASFGDFIILFLYDDRYSQAGWMLPILALGMWSFVLVETVDRCFYALDKPKIPAAGNFCKFIYMIIFVPILFIYFGPPGGVFAVAFNTIPAYLIVGWGLKKEKLSCFRQDLVYTIFLILLIAFFITMRVLLGFGVTGLSLLE